MAHAELAASLDALLTARLWCEDCHGWQQMRYYGTPPFSEPAEWDCLRCHSNGACGECGGEVAGLDRECTDCPAHDVKSDQRSKVCHQDGCEELHLTALGWNGGHEYCPTHVGDD